MRRRCLRRLRSCLSIRRFSESIPMIPRISVHRGGGRALYSPCSYLCAREFVSCNACISSPLIRNISLFRPRFRFEPATLRGREGRNRLGAAGGGEGKSGALSFGVRELPPPRLHARRFVARRDSKRWWRELRRWEPGVFCIYSDRD
jgi:hypothetical protein